jgi:hypothetical protein
MSKLKKQSEKLLRAIEFEPVPLSTNKGRILRNDHCPNKVNSKKRRHRGWITARIAGLDKYSQMFADANEPPIYYDAWNTTKDGIHYDPDRTHIRSEFMSGWSRCRNCSPTCHSYSTCEQKDYPNPIKGNNKKLLREIQIRKAKKDKERLKNN